MKKISCTDHESKEVLQRVKDEKYILFRAKRRKANWIGQTLSRK